MPDLTAVPLAPSRFGANRSTPPGIDETGHADPDAHDPMCRRRRRGRSAPPASPARDFEQVAAASRRVTTLLGEDLACE